MRRVSTYIPTPFMEIPERLHNVKLRFYVCLRNGNDFERSGDFSSAWNCLSLLRSRLVSDASISNVMVYLPSGRLLCEVDGFGR